MPQKAKVVVVVSIPMTSWPLLPSTTVLMNVTLFRSQQQTCFFVIYSAKLDFHETEHVGVLGSTCTLPMLIHLPFTVL